MADYVLLGLRAASALALIGFTLLAVWAVRLPPLPTPIPAVITRSGSASHKVSVLHGDAWLGRSFLADVYLADPSAHMLHGLLLFRSGRWKLLSLSTGTAHNGTHLPTGSSAWLTPGDTILCGHTQLTFNVYSPIKETS